MKEIIIKIKKYLQWMNKASSKIQRCLLEGTIIGITCVVLDLFFVLESKFIIDIATGAEKGDLWREASILIAIILAELFLNVINGYIYTKAENLMRNNLREHLFAHLLIAPLYKRGTFHSGDLTARLEEDVRVVTSNIVGSLPAVVITGTQFVGAFWLLMQFDSHLAWIVVVTLPIFMLIGKIIGVKLRVMTKDIRDYESKIQSHIQEGIQHSSLLRSLQAEVLFKNNFGMLQNQVYKKIMKRTQFTLASKAFISLGFTTGYLFAFIWGCFSLQKGIITFGVMTAFLQLVSKIQGPTASLAGLIPGFIHATTSIDRIMEIENFKTEKPSEKRILKKIPGVRFENMSYTYPGETNPLYQSFNYDFPPGSHTAILGPTGTGKTTLIRLILALIEPNAGKVLIYDEDESYEASPGTRYNISYVPQGNTLMSGTIRENLLLANPEASEEEMKKALHLAVAEFVYDLPEGLETLCGERGIGLSEGQSQRIAIARGLLKPASILLLDEISASLDKDTEALLFKRLSEEANDKTYILITHRISATAYSDQVLQL